MPKATASNNWFPSWHRKSKLRRTRCFSRRRPHAERYWNSENVNGAIPICHKGCAYRDWLVVSGPEAGHVWHDARADQAGLYPVAIATKKRGTFLDWYMHWLHGALAMLPNRRA